MSWTFGTESLHQRNTWLQVGQPFLLDLIFFPRSYGKPVLWIRFILIRIQIQLWIRPFFKKHFSQIYFSKKMIFYVIYMLIIMCVKQKCTIFFFNMIFLWFFMNIFLILATRIRYAEMKGINADPDPQQCGISLIKWKGRAPGLLDMRFSFFSLQIANWTFFSAKLISPQIMI